MRLISKQYTTNYNNTFIETAEGCPVREAEAPPLKEPKTAARVEYDMLIVNPYLYTSDDVLYESSANNRGRFARAGLFLSNYGGGR